MTTDPPGEPPLVLDYATPRSISRQAELDQYVQHLIATGAGPRDIRRYFRRDRDAIQYFCEVKRQLHTIDRLGDRCAGCGQEAKDLAIPLQWRVELKVYYVDIPVTRPPGRALGTLHPICAECEREWRRNLNWDLPRRWMLGLASVVVPLAILGHLGRAWRQSGKATDDLFAVAYVGGLFVLIALARLAARRAIRAFRPAALNRLMPWGVRFVGNGDAVQRGARNVQG